MKHKGEDEQLATILDKFLERPILAASKVKEDTNGYNDHICYNMHIVCSYKDPCFAWFDHPIARLQD